MSLEIAGISHDYGGGPVLRSVSLSAEAGEVTCLLGASGCGKTTLLRLVAGMLAVQTGEIALGGALLASRRRNPPPEQRPVGLVFQEGALFPHLTVAQNIAFGLTGGLKRHREQVDRLLDRIGLGEKAQAYPNALSGGQQQRVALVRALAPSPQVVLLDEPFASVDVVRRRELREATRRTLRERGAISILVTHDPEEAMTLSDKVAVMAGGRIVQAGTPRQLHDEPATAAVGTLFGEGQVVRAHVSGGALQTPFGPWPLASLASVAGADECDVLVRPETLAVRRGTSSAVAEDVRFVGRSVRVTVRAANGDRLTADLDPSEAVAVGDTVTLRPLPGTARAFAASRGGEPGLPAAVSAPEVAQIGQPARGEAATSRTTNRWEKGLRTGSTG
ncbi:ABC transporter ATP-binding protein [Parvularcula oceani]|uniref:ABC transporter ATP-binding protein n=1 Tax=Parvularcula oceani TaxID=1247963 RepID=UPI0009DCBC07|nr:ABC transporter ATP-binding protein [Parvularcula oceani]